MECVTAGWAEHGFFVGPAAHLEKLPGLVAEHPPCARAFTLDPGHCGLGAGNSRRVKDLELARPDVGTDKSGRLTSEFAPNRWKHQAGLRIAHSGVRHFRVDYHRSLDWLPADTVLLDEIPPGEDGGRTQEIALTDAVVTVRCADLRAAWQDGAGAWAEAPGGRGDYLGFLSASAGLPEWVAFSRVFLPRFVEVRGCVLWERAYDPGNFETWYAALSGDARRIEATLNQLKLFLHLDVPDDAASRGSALTLAEDIARAWRLSLAAAFPRKDFSVTARQTEDGPVVGFVAAEPPPHGA